MQTYTSAEQHTHNHTYTHTQPPLNALPHAEYEAKDEKKRCFDCRLVIVGCFYRDSAINFGEIPNKSEMKLSRILFILIKNYWISFSVVLLMFGFILLSFAFFLFKETNCSRIFHSSHFDKF